MKRIVSTCTVAIFMAFLMAGCATTPKTAEDKAELSKKVRVAKERALKSDPGLKKFFDEAGGYAIFPAVGKGAVGIGGAYGRGELYESGQLAGFCTLKQATIGLALGGQTYTELIFFETQGALERFKTGNFTFAAQVSAVALKSGASANAKYKDGVAVFTMEETGLMYEASIGGQKFSYEPK